MRRRLSVFLGLIVVTAILSGVARTALAAPRVVVLRVEFEPAGKVPAASRTFLSERLVQGLADAGFAVAAGDVLRSQQSLPSPETCKTEDCYRVIAGSLGLDYLVIAKITVKEKNYDLKLQLVGGKDGRPAGEDATSRCDLCGIQEVGEKLDKLAQSLLTAALEARKAAAPARLTVQSEPSGASVTIDGRSAGEAPLSIEVPPGPHELTVAAVGYSPVRRKITVEAGVRGLVSIGLLPMAGAPAVSQIPGRYMLALGWAALAVGAGAVGAGVGIFTLDGQRVNCPDIIPMPIPPCRRNTRLAAGSLIGAGGATMLAGGFLVYLGWGSFSIPAEAVLAGAPALTYTRRF
jgi:hypothetical protein